MAILPLASARVSTLQWSSVTQQQIDTTEQQLLQSENELSTGKKVNVGSDDPGAADMIMQLNQSLNQSQAYSTNLNTAQSQLSEVDSTLGSVTTLIQQAQGIASTDVNSTASASQRQADANVVQTISSQILNLANTNFGGSYIYGGDDNTTPPFVATAGGVQYVGSSSTLKNASSSNTLVPLQLSAATAFGALSSQVQGTADLTPGVSTSTRIIDLNGTGGSGVSLGEIQLGNGTTSKIVDLTGADSLGDVINDINAAGVGNITASINAAGNGITLTGGAADNVTVKDVGGGTTAEDLGINQATGAGTGVPVVGTSVQPKVTDLTPLASLRGGQGIDQTDGFTITNGQKTATINLSSATTVQDLLNAINGSGTGAVASINSAGNGINIQNSIQGTQLAISENGGTTAADLGVRSFSPSTPLSQLNGGKGITAAAGGDFQITRTDGTTFNVSLTGAQTVQDVIQAINVASGGSATTGVGVTASFATTGNGIDLTDTAGGSGTLSVTPINNSSVASELGLTAPATSGGTTIVGTDANPIETPGIFSDLQNLQNALNTNNQQAITAAGAALQNDYNQIVSARGANGAQLQAITSRQGNITDQNLATTTLLSSLQDADYTTAVAQFQTIQTSLQASLLTASKVLNLSLLNFLG
jgi:flagellar hook-associated protein 3 FlgL